jgi:hypothetical protein
VAVPSLFSLAVSEALGYLIASRMGEQLQCQNLSEQKSLRGAWIRTAHLADIFSACEYLPNLSRRIRDDPRVVPVTVRVETSTLKEGVADSSTFLFPGQLAATPRETERFAT